MSIPDRDRLAQLVHILNELGVEKLERMIDTRFTGGARYDIETKEGPGISLAVEYVPEPEWDGSPPTGQYWGLY